MYVPSAQPGTTVAGAAGVGEEGGCGDGDDNCVESREEAKRGQCDEVLIGC